MDIQFDGQVKKRDKFPEALWSGTLAYSVCYRTAMTWLIREVWFNDWFIKTIAHSKNKKQTKTFVVISLNPDCCNH